MRGDGARSRCWIRDGSRVCDRTAISFTRLSALSASQCKPQPCATAHDEVQARLAQGRGNRYSTATHAERRRRYARVCGVRRICLESVQATRCAPCNAERSVSHRSEDTVLPSISPVLDSNDGRYWWWRWSLAPKSFWPNAVSKPALSAHRTRPNQRLFGR